MMVAADVERMCGNLGEPAPDGRFHSRLFATLKKGARSSVEQGWKLLRLTSDLPEQKPNSRDRDEVRT